MTEQIGTNFKHGFKQASVWGTGVALVSGDQYDFISDGVTPDAQLIRSAGLNGSPFRSPGRKGNEFHSGAVRYPLDYETLHRIAAMSFGSVAAPSQVGTNLSFLHEIIVAAQSKGIFATTVFWQDDGDFVREYPTVKFGDMTLAINANEEPYVEVQQVPIRLISDGSGANDDSTLQNLDPRASQAYVEFKDMRLLLAERSESVALHDADDEFYISGFELRIVKALRNQSVTTRNAPYVDEPIRNNFLEVEGTITVAEIEDYTRIDEALAKTNMMATIICEGAVIEETFPYTLQIELPSFQWVNPENINIGGPEIIAPSYPFSAAKSPVAIAGYSHQDAVRIKVTNTDPNAALT